MKTDNSFDFERVSAYVYSALDLLFNEPKLFEFKINERTLTQRLSLHLQPLFGSHSVDCEYNRQWRDDEDLVKKLPWKPEPTSTDDTEGSTVYPDIVVHERGNSAPNANVLVVEAKRDSEALEKSDKDYRKLSAFTDPNGAFRYLWGVHINFLTRGSARPIAQVVWFEKGKANGTRKEIRG